VRTGITPAEALEIILGHTPVLGAETVGLTDALGRVLAEPVCASRTLPPADNSAMDGYAVQRADLAGASADRPVTLPVAFEIPAGGAAARPLRSGETARILTGAPLPPGADAVVQQENTEPCDEGIAFRVEPGPGENVRRAGEDVKQGEQVLAPGDLLGPSHVGMLASLGRGFVAVHQRPQVAIVSSGDELVEPDGDVTGGRIVSSNSWSIAARQRLRAGLAADVLVSSAGVSVGDRDHVRGALEKLGCRLLFWGVKMKPGYPLAFGRFGDDGGRGPLVFGLPGNPVSAVMTFEQFVRPVLRRMTGHARLHRPTLRARLGETLRKKPGRLHFVRVTLEQDGDDVVARSTGSQSSGVLRSLTRAQGVLLFPAEARELCSGDYATVQVIDESFLASNAAGF
jgi:molybdopterin molybdotransferase